MAVVLASSASSLLAALFSSLSVLCWRRSRRWCLCCLSCGCSSWRCCSWCRIPVLAMLCWPQTLGTVSTTGLVRHMFHFRAAPLGRMCSAVSAFAESAALPASMPRHRRLALAVVRRMPGWRASSRMAVCLAAVNCLGDEHSYGP